jgi:chromosome segregation ATPase
VRSELTRVREELRLSQREKKSLADKAEGLEDEIEILQTSLDDETDRSNQEISTLKQESESLRKQLQTVKQDLLKAESATADARAEIAAFQGDLQAGEGNKEQLSSRLRDVESQLARVRQDKQGLQDQLGRLNIEVHALRTSKADVEAERDEAQSQVRSMKQQEEETFRLDQERVDLRSAKLKLDGEVRRLREEIKAAVAAQQAVEKELQQEIDRASAEESRLASEIQDLQRTLRGSSEKRELATAKKTIQHLEGRLHELEIQISSGDGHADSIHELSIIRRDLSDARKKETEYLQREKSQKDVLRSLKRQITELERKSHELEISQLIASSPHSSVSGSEIIEVRHQLATAHQTLKDVRAQLKDVEKDAARKIKAATIDLQAKTEAWETEKDQLERALDEAVVKRDELEAKNSSSEATITRLRGKIAHLEKALQAERLNSGEDRTMALERRDLHEMLRETQLQAESLEVIVKQRDDAIAVITAAESQLRNQLKRIREERASYRAKSAALKQKLQTLDNQFQEARQVWEKEKKTFERPKSVVTSQEFRDLESKYREAKQDLEAGKKALSQTNQELHNLQSKFQEAKQTWGTEKKTLSRTKSVESFQELRDLETQLRETKQAWEAEKKALSQTSQQLHHLENQFREARKSWENEKKSLSGSKSVAAYQELHALEKQFREAKQAWESEKKNLTTGVRFVNTSISVNDEEVIQLRQELEEKKHHHVKEMRGMQMQLDWMRSRFLREEKFRVETAYQKRYMQMQIDMYEAWYVIRILH